MLDDKPFNKHNNNAATKPAYLSVWNIESFYGESYIVQDVSFNVHEGEILALLGRNGAGKTTTLRTLARMSNPELRHGEIWLDHKPLHKMASHEAAQNGIQLVPEDRRIISGLTVEENLQLAQIAPPLGWSLERIYDLFPRLKERRKQDGVTLSGGEQQMLAIARVWPATSKSCFWTSHTKALPLLSCRRLPRLWASSAIRALPRSSSNKTPSPP